MGELVLLCSGIEFFLFLRKYGVFVDLRKLVKFFLGYEDDWW